jgi:hypothetical protein
MRNFLSSYWDNHLQKLEYEMSVDIISILERQSNLKCWCQECCKKETGEYNATRVVVCPDCGNKRCPRATNHELECTNSNDVGQKGSMYK